MSYSTLSSIEYDPKYKEIEFLISEYDNNTDPLNNSDNVANINWYHVRDCSEALISTCFDLHVVNWLIRANIHIDGFSGFYQGISRICHMFENNMLQVYPIDDEHETGSLHAAALGWLATYQCVYELKNSILIPNNNLTVNDIKNLKETDSEEKELSFSEQVILTNHADQYFSEQGIPSLKEQIVGCIEGLEYIESTVNQVSSDYMLNCLGLKNILNFMLDFINSIKNQDIPENQDINKNTYSVQIKTPDSMDLNPSYIIENNKARTRQDVIFLLDEVLDYFKKYEPSHPVPILIRRSQKMIGMDFTNIIEELLPESLTSLYQLSGNK